MAHAINADKDCAKYHDFAGYSSLGERRRKNERLRIKLRERCAPTWPALPAIPQFAVARLSEVVRNHARICVRLVGVRLHRRRLRKPAWPAAGCDSQPRRRRCASSRSGHSTGASSAGRFHAGWFNAAWFNAGWPAETWSVARSSAAQPAVHAAYGPRCPTLHTAALGGKS